MNVRPDFTRIAAYMPASLMADKPKRSASPPRRVAQMPSCPLAARTWRAWASYLLSGSHNLPEKDARHLKVCIMQRRYLSEAQMRWIFDIVARHEPGGCGTWGAPK
ncbi:hypothetical protein BRX43_03125 [Sphingomonas sp. S-NIH.Pt15_0812]|nr:hypothetical protein BRX43_03125 [Sphingomonas sp. S-NIH.Pt15_0812]